MSTVRVDRPSAGVAVITLDRPEHLNAITFELVDDLHAALDAIDRDNTCRVVVLTGAGRGFCSGLDLKSIGPSSMSTGLMGAAARMRSQEHIAGLVPHLRRCVAGLRGRGLILAAPALPLSRLNGRPEVPLAGDTLERLGSAVVETEVGADHEVLDRVR